MKTPFMSKNFFASMCLSILFAGLLTLACQTKETKAETPDAQKPQPAFTPSNNSEPITIAAVGDVMIGSTSINDSFLPPNDGRDILKEVTPILSAADIAFGNLEGPMLEGGTSAKCGKNSTKCFAFRVPTRYGKLLKDAGFDVFSLANNHASDFGEQGRTSTKKVLDELGIKHAGSDKTDFAYLTVKGKKIAFIAFAHNSISLNVNDLATARQVVTEQKKKADLVVVSFHGGAEGTDAQHVPNRTEIYAGEQRGNLPAFAHAVVDAGADLVLGHGPHVMRGMEIYKDRLVVYSMGNFATYGMFGLRDATALTGIFEVTLAADGKFTSGKIYGGKQFGRGGPTLDKSGDSVRKVRDLSQSDFPATAPLIADDGTISLRNGQGANSERKRIAN
jgi:poly-gamma-glutamate capsule biosynthesis protein CapA/YwtB (metallophosphatase superfamily)